MSNWRFIRLCCEPHHHQTAFDPLVVITSSLPDVLGLGSVGDNEIITKDLGAVMIMTTNATFVYISLNATYQLIVSETSSHHQIQAKSHHTENPSTCLNSGDRCEVREERTNHATEKSRHILLVFTRRMRCLGVSQV